MNLAKELLNEWSAVSFRYSLSLCRYLMNYLSVKFANGQEFCGNICYFRNVKLCVFVGESVFLETTRTS